MKSEITHYYIYMIKTGRIHYERTTGCRQRAKERCRELRQYKSVDDAFFTVNKILKGVFK